MQQLDINTGGDLQALLSRLWEASEAPQQVQAERSDGLARYKRELYAEDDPNNGESKLVTSDVYEIVEWQLAEILNIIYSPEGVVEFKAEDAADAEAALIETKAVNEAIINGDDGFLALYEAFKNALVMKNGILQVTWDDKGEHELETYVGLSLPEYISLVNDKSFTLTQVTARLNGQEIDPQQLGALVAAGAAPAVTIDAKGLQRLNDERLRIKAIPPEDFRVFRGHTKQNLRKAEFCGHIVRTTVTQMLADGFDKDLVEQARQQFKGIEQERNARYADKTEILTHTEDEVQYIVAYLRRDIDGDGFPELHEVVSLTEDFSVILSIRQVDTNGYVSFAVSLNPHDFYGISKADEVADIQKGKTVLLRQGMNNLYVANEPKVLVGETTTIDEDALLNGGTRVVRVGNIADVLPLVVPFVADKSFPVMEYFDRMRESRTGWSRESAGLDPKALADSTNFVASTIINGAQIRTKLMARLAAETGLRPLFQLVREILRKNSPEQMRVDVGGQEYSTNPRDWKKQRQLKTTQGLGYLSKLEKITLLENLYNKQKEIFTAGVVQIVNMENVYNTLREMARVAGIPNSELYFSDPAKYQAPPPKEQPIDKAVDIEENKTIADTTHKAAVLELDTMKFRHQSEMDKANLELQRRKLDIEEKKLSNA